MLTGRKAVLEMPADAAVSGGGVLIYAGFWARVVALFVDSAIVTIAGVALILGLSVAMGAEGAAIGNILFLLVQLLYWPVMESSSRQATFGKQLLGIQVTDLDGFRTSFVRSLLRNLAKILSAIPMGIGFLLAAFTGRKQALHDMITSCLVVRIGPSSLLKALVVAVAAFVIAAAAGYYYVTELLMPQMTQEMGKQMEQAMKQPKKRPTTAKPARPKPPVAKAPPRPAPKPAPSPQAKMAEAKPAAMPAPKAETKPAQVKPEARPAVESAKPAKVEIKPQAAKPVPAPAPAKQVAAAPKAAPPPAPATKAAVAPAPVAEPKPARKPARVVMRAPAAPAVTPPPPPPAMTPKYNDVMTAVMNRDQAGAAQALAAGFWVDRPDSNGVTPLMAAAMLGDAAMAQLLLRHGANPNRRAAGGSVLDFAGQSGDAMVVQVLKKAGAR